MRPAPPAPAPLAAAGRSRWRRLWPWCAAVAAAHALLLGAGSRAFGDGAARDAGPGAQARPLRAPAAVAVMTTVPAPVAARPSADAVPPHTGAERRAAGAAPVAAAAADAPAAAMALAAAPGRPAPADAPRGASARVSAGPSAGASAGTASGAALAARPDERTLAGPAPTPAAAASATPPEPSATPPEPPPAPAYAAATVGTLAAAPPPAETASRAPPVYATRLPAATRLHYELRRGALVGRGELRFERGTDGRYALAMEGRALGMSLLEWQSSGGVDAHGLAPDRFVDRRRGRAANAANFERGAGRIRYSGGAAEAPLFAGSQDRLSFMVQLAAIAAAAPQSVGPGAQITLFVSGARGDADAWTFTVLDRSTIQVPAGPVPGALHLRREPRKPYDTQVDVWLDPARGHLPVRMRLAVPQSGDATEFLLRAPD